MKKKSLSVCPVCGEKLHITEYKCYRCGTVIQGKFETCALCNLSEEELQFLKVFLLSYGNISLVAKKFGISHPTAKLRLKGIIDSLGWEREDAISPEEVIEMLENGEITVEEALRLLEEEKDG